jgi:hypothetical protein
MSLQTYNLQLQTVNTIMVFFVAMLLFPDVQKNAQDEIDSVIGPDRLPAMEDRPRLPYVGRLIQELLRWHPILPIGKLLGLDHYLIIIILPVFRSYSSCLLPGGCVQGVPHP